MPPYTRGIVSLPHGREASSARAYAESLTCTSMLSVASPSAGSESAGSASAGMPNSFMNISAHLAVWSQ